MTYWNQSAYDYAAGADLPEHELQAIASTRPMIDPRYYTEPVYPLPKCDDCDVVLDQSLPGASEWCESAAAICVNCCPCADCVENREEQAA